MNNDYFSIKLYNIDLTKFTYSIHLSNFSHIIFHICSFFKIIFHSLNSLAFVSTLLELRLLFLLLYNIYYKISEIWQNI